MIQNLKVDVIYHQSPSDFEMEFNLCGCCHMRLLSEKTSDKKAFVKALARDVARSRIIIACGPLFGDDGLISTVATVTGNGLMLCDNKTYGVNSDEQIHIIDGSTPLVTTDGYFGGCIIESGPQAIILLTENKAFRKAIMQNLIHPYIVDISYITAQSKPVAEPIFESTAGEQELYLTQTDDYESESVDTVEVLPIAQDEHNIEFIMDVDNSSAENDDETELNSLNSSVEFDDNYNLMYTEVEKPKDIKSRYREPYEPSQSDRMFIAEHEIDEEEMKLRKKSNIRAMDITIIILVLLLLLAVLSLVYLVVLRPVSMGVSTGDYIKEIFGLTSSTLV